MVCPRKGPIPEEPPPQMGKAARKAAEKATAAATAAEAKQEEKPAVAKCYSVLEFDPAHGDPALLRSLREKNRAILEYVLDPSRERPKSTVLDTTEAAWYVTNGCHHVTGNLDVLTNLTPVCDRWVRDFIGMPMQVCARGSVKTNGFILHDVWYVPDVKVNLVSMGQFSREEADLVVEMDSSACSFKRSSDGTLVGKAHLGPDNLYELDFFDSESGPLWYIVSSAREHMTGDLELLTDFAPLRPSRPVLTHTGTTLQVCGKGSLKSKQFTVSDVSYVPGLNENIISLSQLTDSGCTVEFSPHGCTVKTARDGKEVGRASYGGNELFRLNFLRIPFSRQ